MTYEVEEANEEIVTTKPTLMGGIKSLVKGRKPKKRINLQELEKSKRIFKSATPKYTLDWYIKWIASFFVLGAMSIRGVEEFALLDLQLSIVGIFLWLIVSFLWKDRALIMLNGAGLLFLIRNFIEHVSKIS